MKSFIRWALAFCFLLGISQPTFSQSRNTGEIRGTVTDTSGADGGRRNRHSLEY